MKATFTTIAGLFAAGAVAIPSAHQHEHLHRRQPEADAPVEYVTQVATQVATNTVVQYVDSNGQPASGPPTGAPSQAPYGRPAGYGQQNGGNGQFATMVTAAHGQQVSAQAWNWGNRNGDHGVSWSYGMPAHSGHARPSPNASGYGAPQQESSAAYQAAPSPSATPEDSASSAAYQPAPTAQPVSSQQAPQSSPAAQYSPPAQSSAAKQSSAPAQSSAAKHSSAPAQPSSAPAKSSAQASATSSSAASPSTSASCDITTVVNTHNSHRANHTVPDLAWSTGLANAAQLLANQCKFAHDTDIGKDGCGFDGYGQNLAAGSGADNIADDITGEWYSEEKWYALSGSYGQANPIPYTSDGQEQETGHFTQVVWKGTTHVGCAVASCPGGLQDAEGMHSITVCNYGPAGNFGGEYADNVLKPKTSSSSGSGY